MNESRPSAVTSTIPENLSSTAADFVRSLDIKRPDDALRLLGVIVPASLTQILDGGWIQFAETERYIHFDGRGYGPTRTLNLVEKFVRFLHDRDLATDWQLKRLLSNVDDARESLGIARKHPEPVLDRLFGFPSVERAVEEFADTFLDSREAKLAPHVVSLMFHWHGCGRSHIAFGDFEPVGFAESLREAAKEQETDVRQFNQAILSIAAAFFMRLSDKSILDPSRARELSQALRVEGLTFEQGADC